MMNYRVPNVYVCNATISLHIHIFGVAAGLWNSMANNKHLLRLRSVVVWLRLTEIQCKNYVLTASWSVSDCVCCAELWLCAQNYKLCSRNCDSATLCADFCVCDFAFRVLLHLRLCIPHLRPCDSVRGLLRLRLCKIFGRFPLPLLLPHYLLLLLLLFSSPLLSFKYIYISTYIYLSSRIWRGLGFEPMTSLKSLPYHWAS